MRITINNYNSFDYFGRSVLHVAARENALELAEFILKNCNLETINKIDKN